nr:unnamed protein product [Callosobruchus chinensis]
MYLVQKPSRT